MAPEVIVTCGRPLPDGRGAGCQLLRMRASYEDVAAFEARLRISLPEEYRAFLLEVGDGILCDGEPGLYSLEAVLDDLGRRDPAKPSWYDDAGAAALRDAMTAARGGSSMGDRAFMSLQRNDGIPDGCLTVGDNGGNDFSVLVITGAQRGAMWRTGERWAPTRLGVEVPRVT